MSEKKAITVRLEPVVIDLLDRYADTITAAATLACEVLPELVARSLAEIRGRFSPSELKLVLDASNGTGLAYYGTGRLAGQHLIPNVRDSIALNRLHEKWDVAPEPLLGKLDALTAGQRLALELWTVRLWREHDDDTLWDRELSELAGQPVPVMRQ